MTRTLFLVPMKDPSLSKSRLTDALAHDARRNLAETLYTRTLDFLAPFVVRDSARLAVVTNAARPVEIARSKGVNVIAEPRGSDLNIALRYAAQQASIEGFDRICILPADLASPESADIERLLAVDADVVVCPSQDDGTNALLVSPPSALQFQFGQNSAQHHLKAATEAGLTTQMVPCDSLSFDVDTAACLSRAIAEVPEIAMAVA